MFWNPRFLWTLESRQQPETLITGTRKLKQIEGVWVFDQAIFFIIARRNILNPKSINYMHGTGTRYCAYLMRIRLFKIQISMFGSGSATQNGMCNFFIRPRRRGASGAEEISASEERILPHLLQSNPLGEGQAGSPRWHFWEIEKLFKFVPER